MKNIRVGTCKLLQLREEKQKSSEGVIVVKKISSSLQNFRETKYLYSSLWNDIKSIL